MTTTTTTMPDKPGALLKLTLFMMVLGGAFAGLWLFMAGIMFRAFGGGSPDPLSLDARMAMNIYFGMLVVPVGFALWAFWKATRATQRRESVPMVAVGLTVIAVLALPFVRAFALLSQ